MYLKLKYLLKVKTYLRKLKIQPVIPERVAFFNCLIPHANVEDMAKKFNIILPSSQQELETMDTIFDMILKQFYDQAVKYGLAGASSDNIYRSAQGLYIFECFKRCLTIKLL